MDERSETVEARTNAALAGLSRAERRVGRALLADYPSAGLASAARLAERAEVSPPTVLRFAQSLGYDGFTDLQVALRAELTQQSSGPLTRLADAPRAGSQLDRLLQQARAQNARADETLARLPAPMLEAAVALMADASRPLHLHGGRFSHLLAVYLAAHLEQLRPGVRLLSDPKGKDLGTMMDLTRRDVVVLFDYHRYHRSAAELAADVHRAGATLLLITDDMACPVAPDAEVVLAASSTVGTVYQSMSAGFLLAELLIPLVMDAIGEPARTRMALWEERRRGEVLP
ncbi:MULTISPECIES: MurR/RpiR family transcriptional regulator [Mycolicibacterium]|uniref:Transcriptional regulator, RpiR family n=2 Tax=Mycolicibacterium TaxID=1866885 RepID=A1T978_MYCVP|nr:MULTISPECIES: MurR/RpiR family transcriptional regulator [Mycolicibacterium]ABM13728.1 transcriptional regulator, RpiR family [Mycolicibacterium vanbaalenii PYR-1]MCV7126539.1 MurR/RpiR family transcriptional regulator [Mycolicibacterium vanbaalenii PYR-1]MDN4520129.1 MurR/RpiR family transcriptional regulator [Mycolicibacterium austroafricanum]PQP48026.1 MurR/RpiR family transcriptional regulator [Mycolicibacterium austroafricanum]QRZ09473.1 MurR/RpiR family transcriptional regulator [Myco